MPGKNTRPLAGKPLLAWTIEAAGRSACLDRFILSSDDPEIIKIARAWGCEVPFIRPRHLAADDTPGIEPVIHAIDAIGQPYDYVVLLQPTSPLRTPEDIDACVWLCAQSGAPSCVSVCQADVHPYWMHTLDSSGRLLPLVPGGPSIPCRQQLPPVYRENGAVLVARTEALIKYRTFFLDGTVGYVMPADRSIDIDSELDMLICEVLLKSRS